MFSAEGTMNEQIETEDDDDDVGARDATRDRIFIAAEKLFALTGFAEVSVRDITTAAGVNLAAVNYHFGSKDALLFEIFRTRTRELNRARARLLHQAEDAAGGTPKLRDILFALIAPPVRWSDPASDRFVSLQFLIRARSEGTKQMVDALRKDVTHLSRFAEALAGARPDLPREQIYWRLHFVLGLVHQNRDMELDRLRVVSKGAAGDEPVDDQIKLMVDFAEAGFNQ
jgi:AcrR family transcriptional regulator